MKNNKTIWIIALIIIGILLYQGGYLFSLLEWGELACVIPAGGGSCDYNLVIPEGKQVADVMLEVAGDYIPSNPTQMSLGTITGPVTTSKTTGSHSPYTYYSYGTLTIPILSTIPADKFLTQSITGNIKSVTLTANCMSLVGDENGNAYTNLVFAGTELSKTSCSGFGGGSKGAAECQGLSQSCPIGGSPTCVSDFSSTCPVSSFTLSCCKLSSPIDMSFDVSSTTPSANIELIMTSRWYQGGVASYSGTPSVTITSATYIVKEFPENVGVFIGDNEIGRLTGALDGTEIASFKTANFPGLVNSLCNRPSTSTECVQKVTFTASKGGQIFIKKTLFTSDIPVIAATCSDGIKNQDETDIDCGGVCPACSVVCPAMCVQTWEMKDGVCVYDACASGCTIPKTKEACENSQPQTCTDGIKNQAELGIDCGGPCKACSITPCVGAECIPPSPSEPSPWLMAVLGVGGMLAGFAIVGRKKIMYNLKRLFKK